MESKRDYCIVAVFAAVLFLCVRDGKAQTANYSLGFLAPSPDSVIPASLSIEWNSAFTVALEVMNSERTKSFQVIESRRNTECDWQLGQQAADALLRPSLVPPLIGAVGPACSDAAMSAGRIFVDDNYPLVSFAATSESLSNRVNFPTFFRTVFSDRYQAAAIASSVLQLKIKRLTVLTTQQYYSMNLGTSIADAVGSSASVSTVLLNLGYNSTIDTVQLADVLDKVGKDEFVIMAVQPVQAYDIWTAAYALDRIRWPFWYFGTDGVTAFDPADTNVTDPNLVNSLQGEIGVSPHGSDILNNPACEKFYSYWKAKKYPGFPSEGKNRTRSYVPHLIDAVQTYFLIVDNLIKAKVAVTKETVIQALNGSGPGVVHFEGCTGTVSFDPSTGSRSAAAEVPDYDLVSLTPAYWEVKGEIKNGTLRNLQLLTPPGSEYGPNSSYMGPNPNGMSSRTKVWIIAGTLAGVVAVLALVAGGVYWRRRQRSHPAVRTESMRRIMDFVGGSSFRGSDSFRGADSFRGSDSFRGADSFRATTHQEERNGI